MSSGGGHRSGSSGPPSSSLYEHFSPFPPQPRRIGRRIPFSFSIPISTISIPDTQYLQQARCDKTGQTWRISRIPRSLTQNPASALPSFLLPTLPTSSRLLRNSLEDPVDEPCPQPRSYNQSCSALRLQPVSYLSVHPLIELCQTTLQREANATEGDSSPGSGASTPVPQEALKINIPPPPAGSSTEKREKEK